MKRKTAILLFIVVAYVVAGSSTALAKDVFYYLGSGLIQVVDGDTDSIVTDIPINGWVRESDFSADKKYLYVATNRHFIFKIDLATNQVVQGIDVGDKNWERLIYGFDLAPDGKTAWVNLLSRSQHKDDIKVMQPMLAQISLADGHILRSINVPWSSVGLVSVQDATKIYVIGKDIVKIDVSGEEMKLIGTYPMFEKKWNILPLWDNTKENGGVFMANYYTPEGMGIGFN